MTTNNLLENFGSEERTEVFIVLAKTFNGGKPIEPYVSAGITSCRESCSTYFDKLHKDQVKESLLSYTFPDKDAKENFKHNLKYFHRLEKIWGIKRTEILEETNRAVLLDFSIFYKNVFGNSLFTLMLRYSGIYRMENLYEMLAPPSTVERISEITRTHSEMNVLSYVEALDSYINLSRGLLKFKTMFKDLQFCVQGQGVTQLSNSQKGWRYSSSQILNLFDTLHAYRKGPTAARFGDAYMRQEVRDLLNEAVARITKENLWRTELNG